MPASQQHAVTFVVIVVPLPLLLFLHTLIDTHSHTAEAVKLSWRNFRLVIHIYVAYFCALLVFYVSSLTYF